MVGKRELRTGSYVDKCSTLAAVLPAITPSKLLAVRPTKVTVGDDNATRLAEGIDALELRLAGAQSTHAAASGGGCPT